MLNQAEYFWNHPPRCISGFAVERAYLDDVTFDGHGEEINTVFRLNCRCGCGEFYFLGYYWRNPHYNVVVFVGPLALRCKSCGKVTELIDTAIHGYDGEWGYKTSNVRREGERAEYRCDKCGSSSMEVFVRFEYPDDLFDDDFEGFRGREQDLFTWFSALGKCASCTRILAVTEFECA